MSKETTISPFKFLDSYSRADKDIFFGRDLEVNEIYSKVFHSKILLVYGASGTGKSSLINCGLANKFQESDWLPIHIRRGGNIRLSMFDQIRKQAFAQVKVSDEEKMQDSGLEKVISSVFLDHFKPIYLIFDQFEELFIFGMKEEWASFIAAIKFLMERELEVHFIFVIRGEYLEFLSEFEDIIPEFFDNRVRVEKMTRKKAQESVVGPAQLFEIALEEGFEDQLLKKLNPDNSQIELTFLQVFLDKIYRSALANQKEGSLKFDIQSLDQLGQIGDVLAEFVDEQLFRMPNPKAALSVLKSFVSLQGTKTQRSVEEVVQQLSDIGQSLESSTVEEILAEFVNKRILKDQDDNGKYELRHDSLAQKIYEKITNQERELLDVRQFLRYSLYEFEKRGTLLKEDDLSYVNPYLRILNPDKATREFIELSQRKSDKAKKNRLTRNIIILVIFGLLVTSAFGYFYAQKQQALAEEMAALAQNKSETAQQQTLIANAKSEEARKQALLADQQRQLALSSQEEADVQKRIAVSQKLLAEKEKEIADKERINAKKSEKEALTQEALAKEQKEIAHRLRMIAISREMAVKSGQIVDPALKALVAVQSYKFNLQYQGASFQPEIYMALSNALSANQLDQNDRIHPHSQLVSGLVNYSSELYSVSGDGQLIKTSWGTGIPEATSMLNNVGPISSMAFSWDKSHIYLGTIKGEVLTYSLPQASIVNRQKLFEQKVTSILAWKDGFITLGGKDKLVVPNGISNQLPNQTTSMALVGSDVWVGTKGGQIFILDEQGSIKTNFRISTYPLEDITQLVKHPKKDQIAVGFRNGTISIVDTKTQLSIATLPGHTAGITALSFNEQGEYLLSGSYDRTIRLWQVDQVENPPIVIQNDLQWISSLTFDQQNQTFYAGEYDGTIRRYHIDTAELAKLICSSLERNMTKEEWNRLVASDITYETTCTR